MTTDYDNAAVGWHLQTAGVETVLGPGDADFDAVLIGFNVHIRHRPDAVVVARNEDDVVRTVRTAAVLGTTVTAIGHGHGFTAGVQGGVAIVTEGLAGVEVDRDARTATIGAGTSWDGVLDAATPLGLAPLCGSAPGVGVVGYLLGGGLSPISRTFGYAADHVRSFRVVTGTGDLVIASPEENPDLFWALRGGKGGLGVVTEVTIDLFPLPIVQAGGFFFDGSDAAAVVHAFAEWARVLPESVSTSLALLRLPPLPEVPEPIRGRTVVHVRVAVVGDAEAAEEAVAPIRAAAEPVMEMFGAMPFSEIGMVHNDPDQPMPVVEGGRLLRTFDRDTVDALLAVAGPERQVPLAAVEIRVLGGALSRPPTVPNAVGGRDAGYSLHVVGAPVPELLDSVVPAVIDGVFAAVEPWSTGSSQVNFFGRANDPESLAACWPSGIAERLGRIRDAYDPRGVFPYAGHSVRD
ncbi:MAG: FAD-binding oxidoreductase [Gordonia sp. (in: high G+C Gram-positive bacteria)]